MLRMDETTAMGLLELAEDLAPAIARSDAKPALDRLEAQRPAVALAFGHAVADLDHLQTWSLGAP